MRRTGIEAVGEVEWGTHFCQFYESRQDLIDILVPYFREGLRSNEYCMWITSAPLEVDAARDALRCEVADLDAYLERGQIEILDHRDWYLRSGRFVADEVLEGWVSRLADARQRGFEGLRLTGNTFWLESSHWRDFTRYEETINRAIGQHAMLALCTYSLEKCRATEVIDVVANHQFVLLKRAGRWVAVESGSQKQAKAARRESEERFRTLFTTMSEAFALHRTVFDRDGRVRDYQFLEVNPAFERLTGLKKEDVLGRTVREAIPGIEESWIETYGRVVATGQPAHFEQHSPALGRWYEVLAYRTAEHEFATVFLDVTARKQAEQELARAKRDWELTFDQVPDLIAIIDPHHRIVRANRAMADRLGVSPGACCDALCYRVVHAAGAPPARCPHAQSLLDGREHVEEIHEDRLGGDFLVSCTPLCDSQGTRIGSIHVARDITERKRVEDVLEKARAELEQRVRERTGELSRVNQTLRMISECNQVLVRAATEQELVQDICRSIQGLGGYRMAWVGYAEDDPGRTVRPVASVGFEDGYLERARISWADEERGRGPTGACIRTQSVCFGRDFLSDPELAPWRAMARERGFRSSIALPLIADGRAFGALTIYSDKVSVFDEAQARLLAELADDLAFGIVACRARRERDHARRVAEDRARQLGALATQLGQAEQAERLRLARLIHDHLQQLLVGAQYNLATVGRDAGAKANQNAIRKVSAILDDAIRAARSLTAELSPPVLQEKGLTAGLEWLALQMRQKHGLKVEVQGEAGAEPEGQAVRLLLFEAVRELLFNVVKHARVTEARVDLARAGEDEVLVTVADQGAGFDPDRQAIRGPGSAGFGLFSIRERLICLGGRVSVDSAPGRGSRITLAAPLRTAPGESPSPAAPAGAGAPETEASAVRSEPPAGGRIRVLLADDHAVMRQGLSRLLSEEPDIEVVGEAADGHAAIELTRRLRPDVVLMDVSMPRLSGFDATRRILSDLPATRIIGLSMHEDAAIAATMRQAGAVAYITKSGPPARVVAAIRSCGVASRRGSRARRTPHPAARKPRAAARRPASAREPARTSRSKRRR